MSIIGQHINTAPVAPSWHNGACPKPLEALVLRLLAKDPGQRPESAAEVLAVLQSIDLTRAGEIAAGERRSLDAVASGVFVGRHQEMEHLKAALEEALSGRGRMVMLVGEPGIGKTRTAQELQTYAGLRNTQVLWGRSYEERGAPAYWPWIQSIRSYVRECEPERLRSELGSAAAVVAEMVSDVAERLPGLQQARKLEDPASARFRLFDAVATLLKAASRSWPLMIVLDDLHWTDKPTLHCDQGRDHEQNATDDELRHPA